LVNDRPWLEQCERAALFARQFYEREGEYFPTLDVLARDGTRHVYQLQNTGTQVFAGVRQHLGPALAWCYVVIGGVSRPRGNVQEEYRCLMVLGRDVAGFWYGKLWPLGADGRLGEPTPVSDSRVAMDVLLDGGAN
jgi:hypothetical protein